jgi:putative two-component system response regulator
MIQNKSKLKNPPFGYVGSGYEAKRFSALPWKVLGKDSGARILIVDDEQAVRGLLETLLSSYGYRCTGAASGKEARELLGREEFHLVLCDVNMPGESGLELIEYIAAQYPDTAIVMMSGMDAPEIAQKAMEIGAYDYIIKPMKLNEVVIDVGNALHRRKLEIENRAHHQNLEKMVRERTEALQGAFQDLREAMKGIVQAMALTIEMRDPYTAGHQQRVAELARAIATGMGLSEEKIYGLYMAGMIHDLGKISVPAEILSKPGRLSDAEIQLVRTHPQAGYDILKNIKFPWPIAQITLQHHERVNGSGYPQGLSGEAIMLEAKILAVADVVEAMASHRPYRAALGLEEALKEISRNRGLLYDSNVADTCLRVFEGKKFIFD